ncbi:Conserved_hypothetical protein [Hexamita inflata]|uniref:Uncharacterized protein n=1 Tax=Hexamita inflata TaxID=28002 RepID=A0AA86P2L0_9EUKA|nr:Conserved hypothetical protein [Hexamita inflata]
MAENYSHLQKLCLDTIQSGAIGAFIEFFRLTHMEQPLGNNQPQSFEDLIGTAGVEAPALAPLFSFDSPLGMPLNQLQSLQQLLQQADNAGLQQDIFTQFCALSALSDSFLQNHKLRLKVKMLPLVVPFPQYTQLMKSKLSRLLHLIDSPDFRRQIQEEDPLIAAVAKLKKEEIKTQTFPPVTISYALRARNCLYEYIQRELKNYDPHDLLPLMQDAEIKYDQNQQFEELPKQLHLNFVILLVGCYLRLAISLQQFNLFRAAYQVFQLFLKSVEELEVLLDDKFANHFECTQKNGYKQLLNDEHINMNVDKKDDNLAFASMELVQVPQLYDTILDRKCIYQNWNIMLDDLQKLEFADKEPGYGVEKAEAINDKVGNIEELCEFVYAGRQMAVMNMIQLSCQIFTQQAMSTEDIDIDTDHIDIAYRKVHQQYDSQADKLTVQQLTDPKLPASIKCSYKEFIISLALSKKAVELSLDYKLYSTTLPAFRRFAELVSQTSLFDIAYILASRVAELNIIFEINSLAWQARWARLQNNETKRIELLQQRLIKSQHAALQDTNATKYAVSAASELVFNSPGHDVQKMEQAWNDLQKSSTGVVDNSAIEARVRFGAVKGAQQVENNVKSAKEAEEGHDEDLDDVVFAAE